MHGSVSSFGKLTAKKLGALASFYLDRAGLEKAAKHSQAVGCVVEGLLLSHNRRVYLET